MSGITLNEILLVCAALFPAFALCIYVYKKDRVEKEPIGLLLALFAFGCIICFPAGEIETVIINMIDKIFLPFTTEVEGKRVLFGATYKAYNASKYFIGVALVEEALKFTVLVLVTRKNKNFNCLFDGMIYAVFVSLGFAGLENIFYVLKNGWVNAVMRAVLSVPGHMFFGVLMGYYYSFWHIYEKARDRERELKAKGLINPNAIEFSFKKYIALAIVMPVLAHGLYDYCCTIGTNIATVVFYAFIIFLYFYCFGRIRKLSNLDIQDTLVSNVLVLKKYPYITELLNNDTNQSCESAEI